MKDCENDTLGSLILENPKSKVKVRDSLDEGDYIFFTSGVKTKKINSFLVDGENIFLATGGKANVIYYNGKASYSTDTYSIKGIPEILDNKFLYYFILSNIENINKNMFKGAALKHLQKKDFKELSIPIPTIHKQREIVSILDQTFELIDKSKANVGKNIENSKELFQSKLNEIFIEKKKDWVEDELINFCEEITDGSHHSPKSSLEGEYPYITVRDINNQTIDFTNCKFIDENNYNELLKNGCQPNKGDILFSKDGTVGKVSLINTSRKFVVLSSLAIIRLNKNILLPELAKYIFLNPEFLKSAIGLKTGTAITRIILRNLKKIVIRFPKSIDEQIKLTTYIDQLEGKKIPLLSNYNQDLKKLAELKKSILQKAFTGELTNKKD